MASIRKFTLVDPSARVNLSFKESTRVSIEAYRAFYMKSFGEGCERSELIEQLLVAWFEQDAEFQRFVKALPESQRAALKRQVSGEAGDDKPTTVSAPRPAHHS